MVLAVAAAVGAGPVAVHVWEAGRAAEARDLSGAAPMPIDEVMGGDDPFPGEYLGQPVSFTASGWARTRSTSRIVSSTASVATGW